MCGEDTHTHSNKPTYSLTHNTHALEHPCPALLAPLLSSRSLHITHKHPCPDLVAQALLSSPLAPCFTSPCLLLFSPNQLSLPSVLHLPSVLLVLTYCPHPSHPSDLFAFCFRRRRRLFSLCLRCSFSLCSQSSLMCSPIPEKSWPRGFCLCDSLNFKM